MANRVSVPFGFHFIRLRKLSAVGPDHSQLVMPRNKPEHAIRKLNDFPGAVWSGNLAVQHSRNTPWITISLRIVSKPRRRNTEAVAGDVLIKRRPACFRERDFRILETGISGKVRLLAE